MIQYAAYHVAHAPLLLRVKAPHEHCSYTGPQKKRHQCAFSSLFEKGGGAVSFTVVDEGTAAYHEEHGYGKVKEAFYQAGAQPYMPRGFVPEYPVAMQHNNCQGRYYRQCVQVKDVALFMAA